MSGIGGSLLLLQGQGQRGATAKNDAAKVHRGLEKDGSKKDELLVLGDANGEEANAVHESKKEKKKWIGAVLTFGVEFWGALCQASDTLRSLVVSVVGS